MAQPANRAPIRAARMRWIDRWVGVPICLALTVVARIARLVGTPPPDNSSKPRRVLFIELAEMGTTVLACPAINLLKKRHPDCQVYFLLFTHIADSVRVLGVIPDDHVLTIDASNLFTVARDTGRFMREARRLGIDTAINLETFARFSKILAFLSGARARAGFHAFTEPGLYAGDLLTHRVLYNPHIHTWQALASLVTSLESPAEAVPHGKTPVETECTIPRVLTDDHARRRIHDLLRRQSPAIDGKRLIVVNPNASALIPLRRWPLDRYAALVEKIVADPRFACVITGLASERADADFITERVRSDRVVDLTGQTSLRELIDLFNVAELLVTNDSGPGHLAALTGIHVVVFFGPETPRLYGPITDRSTVMYSDYACSPCVSAYNARLSPCKDNLCLQAIDVDRVHATIARLLT